MVSKVQRRKRMHVKKGDLIHVLSGDDAGKTGKILEVHPADGRVVVEGINIMKKHAQPTRTNPQGGIVERPGPIQAANVMVVCPNCNRPTRIVRQREEGRNVGRQCKHCEKSID